MEIKKIVTYPNDILTTPTKKTTLKKAQPIAVELFKTLNKEGGLGLSATGSPSLLPPPQPVNSIVDATNDKATFVLFLILELLL